MCGICGIWRSHQPVTQNEIRVMNDRLIHRGPDDEGYYVQENLGLGMRRLSIIDVKDGHQPISNEDDSIFIVFNGEIYNYVELYQELVQKGHHFKTRTDTETIIHAYEEYGVECVHRLNGMFAFALWDVPRRRLWICRDRLGKKPLYYRWDGQALLFASELKALLPVLKSPEIEPEAIHHYLSFQYVPTPYTILKGVCKLPPAHHLLLEDGRMNIQQYWDTSAQPRNMQDEHDIQQQLREHVERAVRVRLRSDVPLGAFLSSGIDSAVVVAMMARLMNQPVRAYTVAFDNHAFDESGVAALLAKHVSAEHIIEPVRIHILEDLPRIIPFLDEPFADSSAIPSYYISKVARKDVTVALSGDGGDEIFGGYQRYTLDKLARLYRLIPAAIRNQIVNRIAQRMTVSRDIPIESNYALGLRRLQQVMAIPESASILRWGSYFSEPMKADLYRDDFADGGSPSDEILSDTFYRSDADSLLSRTMYTDRHHYLPDNGMVKVDRMSMANSLELRAPFLDYELVEFMARLPDHYKVNRLQRKVLLRKTFQDILPPDWDKRPKRGFEMPVSTWFRGELNDFARDALLASDAACRDYFRADTIQKLFDEHINGRDDHGRRLWALLILELWIRQVLKS